MILNGHIVVFDKFLPELPCGISALLAVVVVDDVRLSHTANSTGNRVPRKMAPIELPGGNCSFLSVSLLVFPFLLSFYSFSYTGMRIIWCPCFRNDVLHLPPSL